MSIEAFKRIYWIVLDGMGMEHARLFLGSGKTPALSRIAREGVLSACRPSSPGCQTPTALLALFSGAEPRESRVWGYRVPDSRTAAGSISGFSAPTGEIHTIWETLGSRGASYSLMNVAFRNDPIWRDASPGLDFAYDGYRTVRGPQHVRLDRGTTRVTCEGIELTMERTRRGVLLRKGRHPRAELRTGDWHTVELTRTLRVCAGLLDRSNAVLAPLSRPMVRGTFPPPAAAADFIDFNVFRAVRSLNKKRDEQTRIPVGVEMSPSVLGMKQKEALMLDAIRGTPSRLVVGYFPLIDEINHAWFDLLDAPQPDARTLELYEHAVRLVDGLVARVMEEAGRDTLVVLSSDHGAAAFRSTLHVNELLARCGLVARKTHGYDFLRSRLYYHPCECGVVRAGRQVERQAVLTAIRRALDLARDQYGVQIGMEEGRPDDPFAAFLYPHSDTYLSARPPRRGGGALTTWRSGGQHLSPLAGTPWIQAVLGLWTPRSSTRGGDLHGIPAANSMVKNFLLKMLEGE